MKAIIDVTDNACIIRIYETDWSLCDIHVVEELKLRSQHQDSGEFMEEQAG